MAIYEEALLKQLGSSGMTVNANNLQMMQAQSNMKITQLRDETMRPIGELSDNAPLRLPQKQG